MVNIAYFTADDWSTFSTTAQQLQCQAWIDYVEERKRLWREHPDYIDQTKVKTATSIWNIIIGENASK